jgi:hypothetical protein
MFFSSERKKFHNIDYRYQCDVTFFTVTESCIKAKLFGCKTFHCCPLFVSKAMDTFVENIRLTRRNVLNTRSSFLEQSLARELLLKVKTRNSWPPCTNYFRWAHFDIANIFYFNTKQAILMRRSTVLSRPLQLVFPTLTKKKSLITVYFRSREIFQREDKFITTTRLGDG